MEKWRSPWEFHACFSFGSCADLAGFEDMNKKSDPTNLCKSESYRRVVRVTRLTWVDCGKEILSKKNQP